MYSILVFFCPCCCPCRDRYVIGGGARVALPYFLIDCNIFYSQWSYRICLVRKLSVSIRDVDLGFAFVLSMMIFVCTRHNNYANLMFCSRLNENSRQAKASELSLVFWLNENVRAFYFLQNLRVGRRCPGIEPTRLW